MPTYDTPIYSVTPYNADGSKGTTIYNIKVPSKYEYTLIDVSASDAGRTEDMVTQKNRLGQSIRVDLAWAYPTVSEGSAILQAFNAEYMEIVLLDALAGDWITKDFYVGDRKSNLYNCADARWENISFAIIQRDADIV